MLDHRGGIPDFFGPAFEARPRDQFKSNSDFYEFVSLLPRRFVPGEKEEYCNGCYIVLGQIVAAASGQSYESYVEQHIFAKANMPGMSFMRPESAARSYGRPSAEGPLKDVTLEQGPAGSGAGGVTGTAADLIAFHKALQDGALLGPEGGKIVLRNPGGVHVFAGGSAGVSTALMGNAEWTLVVLTNLDPPIANAVGDVLFPVISGTPAPERRPG